MNPPRECAHIFLTVLARFAQWTGVYVAGFVALLLTGSFTIQLISVIRCAAMPMSCAISADEVGYTPNSNSCIIKIQPSPARAPHAHNSPAHVRMF